MALDEAPAPNLEADTGSDTDPGDVEDNDGIPAKLAVQPSKLDKTRLYEVLKNWWMLDSQHSAEWRRQAVLDFKFRSGDQWSEQDKQKLDAQQRPHIVFNRVLTILKAVAGMEINGRHEIAFLPRNNEDTAVNELLTAGSKWMSDQCDAEDEESSAFEDTATCGMGWAENRMDYVEESNGKYIEEHVDPLEMFWDRTACKKNLSDARRLWRVRRMPLGDAMQLFPGFNRSQLNAAWATDYAPVGDVKSQEEKRIRDENTSDTSDYDDTNEVTIVQGQWWEREAYWKVANLQNGTIVEMSDDAYRVLQKRMKMLGAASEIKAAQLYRKVYKQAFLGSVELKRGDSPAGQSFSWKCITGELDKVKGTWFGLVKIMFDPQMWANKWLSQSLHILNTTAKGGVLAEEDSFSGDPKEAEEKYARPDTITWVNKGAIKDGKIIAKPGQGMPQGYAELMTYAVNAIRDVTGINMELLGQQDQNQPGILEHYRKQAGMTILATLFDSLRRFRKQTGKLRLYFIQNYIADGRLIRVVGPNGVKALPLVRDKCLGEYDVVIDDAPTSPNQKEANWQIIQPMLAVFKDQLVGNPEVLAALLEFSPLPSRVVEMVKTFAAQQASNPETKEQKALLKAKLVASINKDQGAAEQSLAKAGSSEATALYDVAMAKHLLSKGDMHGYAAELDRMQRMADLRKTAAETEKTQAQTGTAHADTLSKGAAAMADMVTPRQGKEGDRQLPSPIDHIASRMPRPPQPREPSRGHLPPGARRGKDGNYYIPDPARAGKHMLVHPHAIAQYVAARAGQHAPA